MKKLMLFGITVLSLGLLAACSSKSSDTTSTSSNIESSTLDDTNTNSSSGTSISQNSQKKETSKPDEVKYFKSDKEVNNFFTKYNKISEIKFAPNDIHEGNISTKALSSKDDIELEVINSGFNVYVSIGTSKENEDTTLFTIFKDTIKSQDKSINDTDIQAAWSDIHTGYSVEGYDLKGIKLTYVPNDLTNKPRVDITFP